MNFRLGIACLSACALIALVVAGAGCSKGYGTGVTPPGPSPSPSGSPAPDTLYVQTSNSKVIRAYKGASTANGLVLASAVYPTGDITNGDVVYDPITDTLWYPEARQSNANQIEMWNQATTKDKQNPNVRVTVPFGEGTAAFDPNHHLLFSATTQGPQVSVFPNAETMQTGATPAAIITLAITDPNGNGASPRPQEMLYDASTDRLFASDVNSVVAVFDNFGTNAEAAVTGGTNPTIPADRYLQGLFSPDGLAYAPPPTDVLFIGEQGKQNDIVIIQNASTFNGPVSHSQVVTGFTQPGGMAFDNIRGLLFVYDTSIIYDISNAITASGTLNSLFQTGSVKSMVDGTSQGNIGFGIALQTDPIPPSPSPSPSAAAHRFVPPGLPGRPGRPSSPAPGPGGPVIPHRIPGSD